MRRFLLAIVFCIASITSASAAGGAIFSALTVSSCGGQTLTAGGFYPITMDLTGKICGVNTSSGTVTLGAGTAAIGTVGPGYTSAQTPITASATGTTAAVTATLAATSGKTTYICGFYISAAATAGTAVDATITGTITGTLNFVEGVGATTADGAGNLSQTFTPCVPASAADTAIAVNSGAAGTGGNTAVSAWGYQQ